MNALVDPYRNMQGAIKKLVAEQIKKYHDKLADAPAGVLNARFQIEPKKDSKWKPGDLNAQNRRQNVEKIA